jgi:V/A-type H+-transporting ATPase subunit I
MIVEMRRLLIFGPKRLLAGVMEEVQRIGVVHIDRIETEEVPLASLQLDEATAARQAALERLRMRADGLLSLLPADAAGPAPGPAAEDLSAVDVAALEAEVSAMEGEATALTRRRLEAQEEQELIRTYEGAVRVLSPLQNALAGSRALKTVGFILRGRDLTVVAALRNMLVELTQGRVEVVSRTVEEGKIGVVVAYAHRDAEAVKAFLTQAGISELRLPARYGEGDPIEAVRLMERRKAELPGELTAITRALADLTRRYRARVAAIRAGVIDQLTRLYALPSLAQSRYTFILHGWAPAKRIGDLRGRLRGRFGGDVVVHDVPADPHDAAGVPVLLDNPAPLRPFQRLLGLFRPPRYGTMDPTLYLAIFFPIFVGIVVGDVALGALLFAFGWWMRNKAGRGETWQVKVRSIDLGIRVPPAVLADVGWMARVLGVWTIFFGLIYLEVFGNLIEHHFGLEPIFNRAKHELASTLFYITVAVGLVQVMLGYLLHLVLALRHRHIVGVLESLAMICGVSALFAILGAMAGIFPSSFITPGAVLAAAFGVFLIVGIILKPLSFLWAIEVVSGMGNVLSYARLFGVGLAAAVVANVMNDLGERIGRAVGSVLVGVMLGILFQMAILFVFFTFAGHVLQPARLNWVEFLTKFKYHDETGNSYQPLHKTGGD